jgi:hypothetical protein
MLEKRKENIMTKRMETEQEYLEMVKHLETLPDEEQDKFLEEYYKDKEPFDFDAVYDPYTSELNLYLNSL